MGVKAALAGCDMVTLVGERLGEESTSLMGRSKFVGLFHSHTSGATNQKEVSNWACKYGLADNVSKKNKKNRILYRIFIKLQWL